MKMIKMKYIVSLLVIIVLVTSCADKLDKLPPQAISSEIALTTEENVNKVLIGAYDVLGTGDLFGGVVLRNSELLAADGEIAFTGTFQQPGEIWNKEITTTNSDIAEMWLDGYDAINITNNVLSALDVYSDPSAADLVQGEASFIRGLIYFELVKYFGLPYSSGNAATNLGVPIVLTRTEGVNEESKLARNTVQEVYTQALADLTTAAGLLPADNGVFANSIVANTMIARLNLQMGDYAAALTAANQAISDASGLYFMNTSYAAAFNNESNGLEDIFTMQVTTQDGANSMQLYYGVSTSGGRGDIDIQAAHLAFYDPTDIRGGYYFDDNGRTRTEKWQNQFANVNTVRMAELYLIRAECNVRLSSSVGDTPSNDLQRTRSRVGLTTPIAAPTLNDVLLERKLELAHEGQAIHDFKRTQGNFYRLTDQNAVVGDGLVDGFAYDANELVYPIPDREMNVNKKLVQNAGYSGI